MIKLLAIIGGVAVLACLVGAAACYAGKCMAALLKGGKG